jgi:hypothetical protein
MATPYFNEALYDRTIENLAHAQTTDITINRWIKNTDTVPLDDGTDIGALFEELFNLPSQILSNIPELEFATGNGQTFLDEYQSITSDVITHAMGNNLLWQVDLTEKFMWIALMTAIKTCPSIIKHLIPHINESTLLTEDNFGINCFLLAASNIQSLTELLSNYPYEYLEKITSKQITPLDYLSYSGGLVVLYEQGIVSIEDTLKYKNQVTNFNIIHTCSMLMSSFNQMTTIEYLFSKNKLSNELMTSVDINGCTPLHVACICKSNNGINQLLKTKIYSSAIFTAKHNGTYAPFQYNATRIIQYMAENDYMNEDLFFNHKLYQRFDKVHAIQIMNNTFFKSEFLNKQIDPIITNGLNILFDKIVTDISTFTTIIESTNEKVTLMLTEFFNVRYGILPFIMNRSYEIFMKLLTTSYVQEKHFKEKHNDRTIYDILMTWGEGNMTTSAYEIIAAHQKLTNNNIDGRFVSTCVEKYPTALATLIERQMIQDNVSVIITDLLKARKIESINVLFDKGIVKPNHLINCYQLLHALIKEDQRYFTFVLDNNLLSKELLSMFLMNNVFVPNLRYNISLQTFESILKSQHVTTNILNHYDHKYGSFLNHVKIIVPQNIKQIRPDFDESLFFKSSSETRSYFIEIVLSNDKHIDKVAEYLMNHEKFNIIDYKNIFSVPSFRELRKIFSNVKLGKVILSHKFLNPEILDIKFTFDNNIIQYMVLNEYSLDFIKNFLDKKFVTKDVLSYTNKNGENILMTAFVIGKNDIVDVILNHPNFYIGLIMKKTTSNVSILDMLIDRPDINIIMKYIELLNDLKLITENNGHILLHNLFSTRANIDNLITLIHMTTIEILFTGYPSCLNLVMELYDEESIMKVINLLEETNKLEMIIITSEDSDSETPLSSLLKRQDKDLVENIFNNLLTKNLITEDNLTADIVYQITSRYPKYLQKFEENKFDIKKLLSLKDKENDPLYFKLLDHNIVRYIDEVAIVSKNKINQTLCEYIIDIKKNELFLQLIVNKVLTSDIVTEALKFIILVNEKLLKIMIEYVKGLFTDEVMIKCLNDCVDMQSHNITIFVNSEYFKKEHLESINSENLLKLSKTHCGMKYLFDNNLVSSSLILANDCQIFKETNNPQYLKKIIDLIDPSVISNIKLSLHKLSKYPELVTRFISKNKELNVDTILDQDHDGSTFLHILAKNKYINDMMISIGCLSDDKNVLKSILTKQDKSNESVISLCLNNDELFNVFINIAALEIFDRNILMSKDKNNKSLITLASIRADKQLFKKLFGMLIEEDNKSLTDIIEVTTINNSENLITLLSYPEFTSNQMMLTDCFSKACRYQSRSIGPLLKTGKIDLINCYDLVKIDDENGVENYYMNYLQIACMFNYDSVIELLSSNIDLTEAFNEQNHDIKKFNAFILAVMYQPEIVDLLIGSKYITEQYIKSTNELLNKNILLFAIETQYASCTMMFKYDKFNSFKTDITHGNLEHKYKNHYLGDNATHPLLKKKDTLCKSTDSNACSMCFANKNVVVFAPCSHKSCVRCSMKIYNCPQCRAQIKDRLLFD